MALAQSHQLLLYDDPHSEYCAKACASKSLLLHLINSLRHAQQLHTVALGAETAKPCQEVSEGQLQQ
jgi:hypothetical protein